MTSIFRSVLTVVSGVLAALLLGLGDPAASAGYKVPRTAAGQPDIEGEWSIASLTTLERPAALTTLVVPEAEAKAFEATQDGTPNIPDDITGQKQSEWWDRGATLGRLDGQIRSSWLIDPTDGRLPYSPAGAKALQAAQAASTMNFDNPESRPTTERCLMGPHGSTGAPLQNTSYSNFYQVVQTPGYVVIAAEINHDVRIIPLNAATSPVGRSWSGVSVGHWEGDTLVVETSRFPEGSGWRAPSRLYLSPNAKVTERFTRTSPTEIHYEYAVEDPAVFTRVWRGEMPMTRTAARIYEFACHEGNYSLSGVLAGGRQKEREAAAAE